MLDSNMLFMAVVLLVVYLTFNKKVFEKFTATESESKTPDTCNLSKLKLCTDGKFCVNKDNKFTNPINADDFGECKKCTNNIFDGLGVPGVTCNQ